jgi:DNA-binding response OmpR family regulator
MKRRILLVDDEVAVLLTLKAVLEINGFDVDTATSAREGKHKLHAHQYHMVITDMRMESDSAGSEVVAAARKASYHPAVAMLTAFPVADDDWQEMGADKMLVKPMHTRVLLEQIEKLLAGHEAKLAIWSSPAPAAKGVSKKKVAVKKVPAKKAVGKRVASKVVSKKATAKKVVKKAAVKKTLAKKAKKK